MDMCAPQAEKYRLTFMMNAAQGTQVRATCGGSSMLFAAAENGWQRAEAAEPLSLAEGVNTIALRLSGNSSIRCFKSVEAGVREACRAASRQDRRPERGHVLDENRRLRHHGAVRRLGLSAAWRAKLAGFAEDFDAAAFVQKVDEMGGKFIVWSDTLMLYQFPAPIAAISEVLPNAVSKRDLLGDLMKECKKRDIRFITYYHMGHDHPQVLIDKGWDPGLGETRTQPAGMVRPRGQDLRGSGEPLRQGLGRMVPGRRLFLVSRRLRTPDDRAKTGNPKRLVGYNPWIAPVTPSSRITTAARVSTGADAARAAGGRPPARAAEGFPALGLLHVRRGLGHCQPQRSHPRPGKEWTVDRVVELTRKLEREKYSIAINLAMYEDGTISPDSYRLLVDAAKRLGRGPWKKQP